LLLQDKWIGITTCLRIDPDKLHLVSSANGGDLHRQKTLGLLCWIEEEPKNATFEKLIHALVQVDAKALAGKVIIQILVEDAPSKGFKVLSGSNP